MQQSHIDEIGFERPDRDAPLGVPQHDPFVGSTAGEPPAVGGEGQAHHQVGVDGLEFRRRPGREIHQRNGRSTVVTLFATASMRSSGENAAGPMYGRLRRRISAGPPSREGGRNSHRCADCVSGALVSHSVPDGLSAKSTNMPLGPPVVNTTCCLSTSHSFNTPSSPLVVTSHPLFRG
jgi:hypothetical protein